MAILSQNVWKVYGLRDNPFSTKALSTSNGLLPIAKAFVGRSLESLESERFINILRNPGGACLVVEGEIGVGKTTFVNYHRYLWEHEAEDKLLSPLVEIGISPQWTLKDFLFDNPT